MDLASTLATPTAQRLLQSCIPARLAYTVNLSEPRVTPVWFHWTGTEIVIGRFVKNVAQPSEITSGDRIAVCIDTQEFPYQALTLRGIVKVDQVNGLVPEYEQACRRYLHAEAEEFLNRLRPRHESMVRITFRPSSVHLLDMTADETNS